MCVFIKLHITTQSGPVILVILCHSWVCVSVLCGYLYQIVRNRAILPCHPSYSMSLALILPRGSQGYLLCVYVHIYIYVKLHIIAQSSLVFQDILCHSQNSTY